VPRTGGGATTFKQIPILELDVPAGLWVGNKLGVLAREHFQRRSALNAAENKSLFAIPYVKLGPEVTAPGAAMPAEVQQNPNRGRDPRGEFNRRGYVVLGKDDGIGFAEPTGSAYDLVDKQLEKLVDEMFRVVHQMASSVSATKQALARAAASKAEDRRATEIVLAAYGALVRDFAKRIYDCLSAARGESVVWTAHGLDKFELDDRDSILKEALALDAIAIPSTTFRQTYKTKIALALVGNVPPETQDVIFDRIKGVLSDANSWFDANHEKVTLWADIIGERLGSAFDFARDKIRAWWPEIEAFAEHAYDRIASIWHRVGPLVEKVADSAAKALGNDKTFDRLEQIGLLYAGMKGGGLLSGLVPSLPALGGLDRLVRSSGIAGQVAPEGSAFDAMAGRFRDLMSGQFVAGEAGGLLELLSNPVTIGAAAAAALLLVDALVGVAGALHALGDETSSFHDFAVSLWSDIQVRAGSTMDSLGQAWRDLEPWLLRAADNAGVQLLEAIRLLAMGAEYAAHVIERTSHLIATALDWLGVEGEQGHTTRRNAPPPIRHLAEGAVRDALSAHVKVGGGGGGGGVHVDRVEITISSNQDPNRVARVVAGHLADLARYRKSSPYVPNFSASR